MDEWLKEEPGWYTHPIYGGICKETDGWYLYPMYYDSDIGIGPYKTLRIAKQAFEMQMCQPGNPADNDDIPF